MMLTTKQLELLQAMAECDSLSTARHSLRVLKNLENKGFAECFDCEPSFFTSRMLYRYCITDEGRKALSSLMPFEKKLENAQKQFEADVKATADEISRLNPYVYATRRYFRNMRQKQINFACGRGYQLR